MKYLLALLLTLQSFCYQACGVNLPLPMPLAGGLVQEENYEAYNNANNANNAAVAGPKFSLTNLKSGNSQFATYTEVSGTVSRIWDGDTVTLDTGDRKLRIRLAGIDAPETDQPFGRQATHLLRYLALNKQVEAHIFTQDKYHRYIARLYLQQTPEVTPPASAVYPAGIDIGQLMIARGMAWHYYFFDKKDPYYYHYQKAERQARQEGLGIWQELSQSRPGGTEMKKQQLDQRRIYLAILLFLSIYGRLNYKETNHEQAETNPAGSPDWLPVGENGNSTGQYMW